MQITWCSELVGAKSYTETPNLTAASIVSKGLGLWCRWGGAWKPREQPWPGKGDL